ncbi:uncharacterized protein LOC117514900 [Thalassophryne amazonica]|uniref:uncharacterized protein LOC117514900 n=1 Tax=Thalassophryne amazonica TaxID=390379 RepID=UPI00147185C9|nr:uncharacterized protein LOC117514900 [Thalassophryne amazonica]
MDVLREDMQLVGVPEAVKEDSVHEKHTCDLEMINHKQEVSQSQLHKPTTDKVINSNHITRLEAERNQLIREKQELLDKIKEGANEKQTEMKGTFQDFRESLDLDLEKQKLQDHSKCLESKVQEQEAKLQVEEYQKRDASRVQRIEELKALASHWMKKRQKVAMTYSPHKRSWKTSNRTSLGTRDSLLMSDTDACREDLEKSRSLVLLHKFNNEDEGGEATQTQEDQQTETSSQMGLSSFWERPSDSTASNKTPQNALERRCWWQGSGLMPVFEEDEEEDDEGTKVSEDMGHGV